MGKPTGDHPREGGDEPRRVFDLGFRRSLARRPDLDRLLAHLAGDDVPVVAPVPTSVLASLSWDEARHHQHENVLWSGRASGTLGPGPLAERGPCDLWLTTLSLLWAAADGGWLHRLPLAAVRGADTFDKAGRAPAPGLAMAYETDAGKHQIAVFLFDWHAADRARRKRGAFLVGIRARGVPIAVSAVSPQPWHLSVPVSRDSSAVAPTHLLPSREHASTAGTDRLPDLAAPVMAATVAYSSTAVPRMEESSANPLDAARSSGWRPALIAASVLGLEPGQARIPAVLTHPPEPAQLPQPAQGVGQAERSA